MFDSRCASVYVIEENAVAYLPHGTDLFPRLVRVAEVVKDLLEREVADIETARDRFESIPSGTKAFEAIETLSDQDAKKRVDSLVTITTAETERLEELRMDEKRMRSDDPAKRATELRLRADRLKSVRARLVAVESVLVPSAITVMLMSRDDLTIARQANDLVSTAAFADTPIGGVGGDPWRALWNAAKAFASAGAVPPQLFPPDEYEEAACVLCQQPLELEAKVRMQRFEAFVRGEARSVLDEVSRQHTMLVEALRMLAPSSLIDVELAKEIASVDPTLADELNAWSVNTARVRDLAISAAVDSSHVALWQHSTLIPSSVGPSLETLELRVRAEAAVYDGASDPDALQAVSQAVRELEGRIALGKLRERAYAEVERQTRKKLLKKCIASTNTTSITRQNTEILRDAVSQPLADAFAKQIAALKLTHLPVVMAPTRGEKGRAFHALAIDGKNKGKVPKNEILSEGEHRGVALAAFFAEIALQDSASTVVFDDPVSSMDHWRRKHVATEIVEIARSRPVLVFTHDLPFLGMLQNAAAEADVALHPRFFRRDSVGAGLITEDWPWDGQNVSTRIGVLKQMAQSFKAMYAKDLVKYEDEIRKFYDKLRTTWERAIEDILFNGAIGRFDAEVQTKRLAKLHRVTEAQMLAFDAGMTRASAWVGAHDHAAALALPLPTPEEADVDLKALDAWVDEVRRQYNKK